MSNDAVTRQNKHQGLSQGDGDGSRVVPVRRIREGDLQFKVP